MVTKMAGASLYFGIRCKITAYFLRKSAKNALCFARIFYIA